jgi:vacuolar-type H+-ATPase subunit F/Vma7
MNEMFILGDEDTITGFNLAGVAGESVESSQEALEKFGRRIRMPGLKILIVTQPVVEWIKEDITRHRMRMRFPLVVEIPDAKGDLVYRESLTDIIRQAIGISI